MERNNIQKKIDSSPYPKSSKVHGISFKYALDGIKWVFQTQPNFRIHVFIFIFIILLTAYMNLYGLINYFEILAVLNISALVIVMESVNTAIEGFWDEIAESKYKEFIRIAKDVSIGSVLISAIFSVIIGLIIYLPKIWYLIFVYK